MNLMTVSQLTSRDNPLLKTIRLVSSGSRRAPKQLVIAEGIRVLEEVENAGSEIEAVVFSADFGSTTRGKNLLEAWLAKRLRVHKVSGALFRSISTVDTPQGAIALVRVPELTLENIRPGDCALVLCACEVQDPGNLGTLIRSAAAAGASLVCTTQGTVSARNSKAVRSSAGSFFRMPVLEHIALSEFRNYCETRSIRLYRADARKGVIYTDADLKSPCAILLGNEGAGLAGGEYSELPAIRIPLSRGIESLNVAIAGAVILFEARRQRSEI